MESACTDTTATVAKKPSGGSAWGTRPTPPKAESLSEVMSRQLADRILEEQESLRVEQMLRDEALAISLQQQFDGVASGSGDEVPAPETEAEPASADSTATIEDTDRALAAILQRDFDREFNRELQLSEDRMNRDQKVRVTLASHRLPEGTADDDDNGPQCDEDDDEEDEEDELHVVAAPTTAPASSASSRAKKSRGRCCGGGGGPAAALVTKHDAEVTGRRNADRMSGFGLGFREGDTSGMDVRLDNRVYNALRRHAEGAERRAGVRMRDKRDRGTAEAALDEKTRGLLFKQVSAGVLGSLGGVVATGKESVVLHAYCNEHSVTPSGKPMPPEVAIKVFKTSLNEFKSRSDYVTGDFRVCKDALKWQNPRKVMRVWCEKEMLSLRRLRKIGLPCPQGLLLRGHVLIMSFIGEAGCAAPRLKDCRLEPEQWASAWLQAETYLRRLYTECRLVHADFSEYNLLWWRDTLWIIDVSQAVDVGHPKALDFLLRDCRNACAFFSRQQVADAPSRPEVLFNRVTGLNIPGRGEEFVKRLADHVTSRMDFEGDRMHLEHGVERRRYQFEHFFEEGRADEGDAVEADEEGEDDDDDDGDWVEAEADEATGAAGN